MPNTWQDFFPTIDLPKDQLAVWETLHEPSIIRKAMAQLAVKKMKIGGQMQLNHMIRFASAVMNRLDREAEAKVAKLTTPKAAAPVTVAVDDNDARWNR